MLNVAAVVTAADDVVVVAAADDICVVVVAAADVAETTGVPGAAEGPGRETGSGEREAGTGAHRPDQEQEEGRRK